jgi:hypothetical protein
MSIKKKSINKTEIVGTLVEVGNLVYDKDVVNKNNNKLVGAITRADFKKPAFVVEVNGQKIGVNTMPVYKDKVDKDTKKIVENERFKAFEKIMTYEVGTRVSVNGTIQIGKPYMGKNGIVEPVSINMFSLSTTGVGDTDYAEGKVSGYIKSIKPEVRGEDEDETGRLLVELWMYNDYDDSVAPFTLVVEKDIAEGDDESQGFEDVYSEGDNAILDFDIVSRQVGGKKSKSAFGKKESKIVGGFSVTEYSIFNGEAPMDEESEYYIDEDDFKKLFKAHKQKCEEAKNQNAQSNEDTPKGLRSARKSKVEDVEDDDESPFD